MTKDTLSIPHSLVKLANVVFVFGIGISVFVLTYCIYKLSSWTGDRSSVQIYFFTIFVAIFLMLFFAFGLRLRSEMRVNLSLIIAALAITTYAVETYLTFPDLWVGYDSRTPVQVINDQRQNTPNVYPHFMPKLLINSNGLSSNGDQLYPLGSIANTVTIIEKNENGYYPIYKTDQHGFSNLESYYANGDESVVLIGDSFAEGYSVHQNETIAARLRQLGGISVLSYGKGGNGPLLELATLREYAKPLKPKVVIWLFYQNDLSNLSHELQVPILSSYLHDEGFSQNLLSRQQEIDKTLREYLDLKWNQMKEKSRLETTFTFSRVINVAKLVSIRSRLNMIGPALARPSSPANIRPEFKQILDQADKLVSSWDGTLYFIYLPSFYEISNDLTSSIRRGVLQVVSDLDIPLLNIGETVFQLRNDPLSLFPGRKSNHYNSEGYHLVAKQIAKRLKSDGFFK